MAASLRQLALPPDAPEAALRMTQSPVRAKGGA
jgi:hypothetical protein